MKHKHCAPSMNHWKFTVCFVLLGNKNIRCVTTNKREKRKNPDLQMFFFFCIFFSFQSVCICTTHTHKQTYWTWLWRSARSCYCFINCVIKTFICPEKKIFIQNLNFKWCMQTIDPHHKKKSRSIKLIFNLQIKTSENSNKFSFIQIFLISLKNQFS